MSTNNAKYQRWRCDNCDEYYEDEWDARECCPSVTEIIVCPTCEETWATVDQAEECCADAPLTHRDLESLGQMRLI